MKDTITNKSGLKVYVRQRNTEEKSRIFCDKMVYMHNRGKFAGKPIFDHHLMFYLGKKLVFKVWLKQKKRYKDIHKAMEDVGIVVLK